MNILQQVNYEQQFNNYCTELLGMRLSGELSNTPIYFSKDDSYAYMVKDYDPYNNEGQLEDVIDFITCKSFLYLDPKIRDEQGKMAAMRHLVDIGMGRDDDKEVVEDVSDDLTRRLFKGQCAKIMGWHRGAGSRDFLYFDNEFSCFGEVEDYNPYDNIEQIEPVIDSLISALGLRLDTGILQREGILKASRQLILDNMLPDEDVEQLLGAVELVDGLKPHHHVGILLEEAEERIKEFNEYCASVMDYVRGYYEGDDGFWLYGKFIGRVEDYTPYDDIKQLIPVIRTLQFAAGEAHSPSAIIDGDVNYWRDYVFSTALVEAEDIEEEVDSQCHFKEVPEVIYEKSFDMKAIGNPASPCWQAARILVLAGYRGNKSFYVDQSGRYQLTPNAGLCLNVDVIEEVEPFENTPNSILQLVTIESFIRNPANGIYLWEKMSMANKFDVTDQNDISAYAIHQHRKIIIDACLNDMTREYWSDERKFNELCIKIKTTFECEGYCLDTSTFSPYNNIQQLAGIVEKVLLNTSMGFNVVGGSVDMMKEMRRYVTTYGNENYMDMSPPEEKNE